MNLQILLLSTSAIQVGWVIMTYFYLAKAAHVLPYLVYIVHGSNWYRYLGGIGAHVFLVYIVCAQFVNFLI